MFAITGHTSGIGQAVQSHFGGKGFSRSNGYDIDSPKKRNEIIEDSKDCNVFINSAHSGFSQAQLLNEIFISWQDKPKHIINIGSSKFNVIDWELVYEIYSVEKLASHAMCSRLQMMERKCKLTNLCLGKVENIEGDLKFSHIINAIQYVLDCPYEVRKLDIW